ncbi:MAG: alanine--tRNA ligase [Candidatus Omnitrophota bacterium]|nr:alanine--tRNA ligase [Candidatus Omnitrophota bacterium]
MNADTLRKKFLDFFKSKKHKIIASDSLSPADDSTVLFTPAGMNQFKKEFLGFDSGFKRAATSQRCLRTDDLDKVGRTSGHLTFFEMLGNFSFGDYFKKEAILFAWEFLTEVLKIDKERLWVSVYKDDDEAYKIWRQIINVPEGKIIKLGDKQNFWPQEAKEKGPNGPCGPCSEIFFDWGKDTGCLKADCNPSCDCQRFSEIWNLVFTQYNRKEGGALEPLPNKNIDTGMGLERLTALMQGVRSNFETDLFKPIIKEITGCLSAQGAPSGQRPTTNGLIYAIADHIRAITFAIYDGVMPSNEARGYVVRKIIRKSILHMRQLEINKPFLYKLVPVLSEIMKQSYPEINQRQENISEVILSEEKSFFAVLDSSEVLFKDKFEKFIKEQSPQEVGKIAFQLHDTYGLPYEFSASWLTKHGIKISEEAFLTELDKQKERSRAESAMKGDVFNVRDAMCNAEETKFLGHKEYFLKARVLKIIKEGSTPAKKITKAEKAVIILDKTVFYPESGGQIGDAGELFKAKNCFNVLDTKKIGKVIAHIGVVREGSFKTGDFVTAKIDISRRLCIARNHTATHLLQAALRKVLGSHIKQQGSLVAPDKLRFDFQHFKNISKEELDRIEEVINSCILENSFVLIKQKSLKEAKKQGALAFFGEKYAGRVRVVSIGDFSKELCAGTHLDNAAQIGLFKIIHEGSIAGGVRRIEAQTAHTAYKLIKIQQEVLNNVSFKLGVPWNKILHELDKRDSHIKELEKELNAQKMDSLKGSIDDLIQSHQVINNIRVIAKELENLDMNLLRKNVDFVKGKIDNCIVALGSKSKDGVVLVIGITADLCERGWDAVKLIKAAAIQINGSGGGRQDFAQAGGNSPENLGRAFEELKSIIINNCKTNGDKS